MGTIGSARCGIAALGVAAMLVLGGCGGGDGAGSGDGGKTSAETSKTARAAAISLDGAMDIYARAVDTVHGNQSSVDRLAASLEPAVAQTSDVIGVLTPSAGDPGVEATLLNAARQQRTFLQSAVAATQARTRAGAVSAVNRARDAGRQAASSFSGITQSTQGLAGLLPDATAFATGRLGDAIRAVHKKPKKKATPKRSSSSPASSGSSTSSSSGGGGTISCGDGLSVNSVTSCPFARSVRANYEGSGGSSNIDVYSPVTKRNYVMHCTSGVPTVCRGGNGAVVYIR